MAGPNAKTGIILVDNVSRRNKEKWAATSLLESLPAGSNGALKAALAKVLDRQMLAGLEAERFEAAKKIKESNVRLDILTERREELVLEISAAKSAIYSVEVSGTAKGARVQGEIARSLEKMGEYFNSSGDVLIDCGGIFSQSAAHGAIESEMEFITFDIKNDGKSAKFAASKFTIQKIDELQKEMYGNSLEILKLGKEVRLLQEQVQTINQIELSLRAALGETELVAPRRLVFAFDPHKASNKGFINPGDVEGVTGTHALDVVDLIGAVSFGNDANTREYRISVDDYSGYRNLPPGGKKMKVYERENYDRGTIQFRWMQHAEGTTQILAFNRGPAEQDAVLDKYLDGNAPDRQEDVLVALFGRLQQAG